MIVVRIDFYHLQKSTLDEALPLLVSKAYQTGKHIKIKIGNEVQVSFLSTLLWTFDEESFLPHGTKKDEAPELQPIYLSSEDDLPNGAKILFVVDGADISLDIIEKYERVLYIFNGQSENELIKARNMWKMFQQNGSECHYWKQNELGKWEVQA